MIESVPTPVEAAIYLYFGVIAAVGCYLHGRLWLSHRGQRVVTSDRTAATSDERP
ncbi:hypothetical protein [Natronorubrum aibiense]|uniref:hypothetical protein n=1 Tax=Natronorubrum aibiense TaxID=348826 RepID=UPI0014568FF1|nr:hypothetical protein [Natronorubrum aibiense]